MLSFVTLSWHFCYKGLSQTLPTPTIRNINEYITYKADLKFCLGVIIPNSPRITKRCPVSLFAWTYVHLATLRVQVQLLSPSMMNINRNTNISCLTFYEQSFDALKKQVVLFFLLYFGWSEKEDNVPKISFCFVMLNTLYKEFETMYAGKIESGQTVQK